MNRRNFLGMSGVAAGLSMAPASAQGGASSGRDYYELRKYILETAEQRAGLDAFLEQAAIPALNRLGIEPVGVFSDEEEISPVYVLLRYDSLDSLADVVHQLGADAEFMEAGADFINAPAKSPAYARIESSLMVAFTGMPNMARPTDVEGRVFQLRIYESPSHLTGQTKIQMFNGGEIDIFLKTGLTPVFFGETLVGEKIPNLTYMLSFESRDAQNAAWKTFLADPDWKEISSRPEYANEKILSGITNINLVPTGYSQL